MEDPFDDAAEETDPDASRGMLKEYDERIQSGKSQKSLSSTDAIIDREFPSNDETVQETGFSSFPELVEQKEEHVEDRPPEYQEYSASRTALTESHDLTISEHGPETGETRLANSSPESSRAVSTSRTGDTEASTSPSMTPYEQLLERRLSLIAGDCRFLDPASGSETTSEDMEGCSSASLCPTETVKVRFKVCTVTLPSADILQVSRPR